MKVLARKTFNIVIFILITVKNNSNASNGVDNLLQEKINEAGCPFVTENQLIERNVCLLPDYASNESPKTKIGVTTISIYFLHVYILEVEEQKNQLTMEILQYIDWKEPRIRANFTSAHTKNKIKVSSKNFRKIWHPDLDIYTKDLKDWKSLYDPFLYQEMYIYNTPNETPLKLSALKGWKVKIFCKFDFSLFPFDTQKCAFRQFGSSRNIQLKTNCRDTPIILENKPAGVSAFLISAGQYCEQNKTWNSLEGLPWMDVGFNITLERTIQPYLYQYYFPCIAIVVVSQISFMIPVSAIPGRIALVVTQFLTLTNIFIHQMVSFTSELV